jgi:hypothetical protein
MLKFLKINIKKGYLCMVRMEVFLYHGTPSQSQKVNFDEDIWSILHVRNYNIILSPIKFNLYEDICLIIRIFREL